MGLGARAVDGVEGVLSCGLRVAEAGRAGGPIDPLLLSVLERLREGEGPGETCDRVSMVLSDNEGRGLRFSGLAKSSFLAPSTPVAFSSPSSVMAEYCLFLGGVVSKDGSLSTGGSVLVGGMTAFCRAAQPNDVLTAVLLLSPKGRIFGVRVEDLATRDNCGFLEDSS